MLEEKGERVAGHHVNLIASTWVKKRPDDAPHERKWARSVDDAVSFEALWVVLVLAFDDRLERLGHLFGEMPEGETFEVLCTDGKRRLVLVFQYKNMFFKCKTNCSSSVYSPS